MKIILIVLIVVAALGAGVVLIGVRLPRDHVVTMAARVAGSPGAIWAVLTDPSQYPSWRSEVTKVDILPATPAGLAWREHSSDGAIAYVIDRSDRPTRLATRISDPTLPFGGGWDFRIEPVDAAGTASTVTITERGSVYNPVYRFASRFVIGHTATIARYLRALSRRFGGESAPVRVEAAASP